MGHAKFRLDMLARHGTLVPIRFYKCSPELVKARLEEATGLPLYEAFAKSAPPQQGMLFEQSVLNCWCSAGTQPLYGFTV